MAKQPCIPTRVPPNVLSDMRSKAAVERSVKALGSLKKKSINEALFNIFIIYNINI